MTWYIPEDSPIYNWSLDWRVPITVSLIYAILVTYFGRRNVKAVATPASSGTGSSHDNNQNYKTKKLTNREPWTLFRVAVTAHNVLLMAFSGLVFYSVFPLLLASFRFRPYYDSFCDVGGWVYRHGLGFWTWVFYMSKYYELIDTAILLAKGRPSSFLQTYHHAGAIISMWMLSSTRAFGAWIFVCFNSFIHTFMYFYYTLTCFGYQPRWKRFMTYMQLAQFIIGLPLSVVYVIVPNCVQEQAHPKDSVAQLLGVNGYWSHFAALTVGFSYVAYLVVLFLDFARRTYFGGASKVATTTKISGTEKPESKKVK